MQFFDESGRADPDADFIITSWIGSWLVGFVMGAIAYHYAFEELVVWLSR